MEDTNTQPEQEQNEMELTAQPEEEYEYEEPQVSFGTKLKVVAALAITAFATYIAFWVQEPAEVNVNVLADLEESTQTDLVAQAPGTEMEVEILIDNFSYLPANLPVEAGTKVVWTNTDSVAHTVTSDTFSSELLQPGDAFTYTFNEPGTFEYSCEIHPNMKGTITVEGSVGSNAPMPEEVMEEPVDTTPVEIIDPQLANPSNSAALPVAETTAEPPTPIDELMPAAEVSSLDSDIAANNAVGDPALDALTTALETATLDAPVTETQALIAEVSAPVQSLQFESAAAESLSDFVVEEEGDLSETGPAEMLYIGLFGVILYMNRRKLGISAN